MPSRISSHPPSQPAAVRTPFQQSRLNALRTRSDAMVGVGGLSFNGTAPRASDIARQFEVREAHPCTYPAIELTSGEFVIKETRLNGFAPSVDRFTKPMESPDVSDLLSASQPAARSNDGQSPGGRARQAAIEQHADAWIRSGRHELLFSDKAPRAGEVVREFPLRSTHPFTYTALELKNGDYVIKQVLTGGFAPARPGSEKYSMPLRADGEG